MKMEIVRKKNEWNKILKTHFQKIEDTYFTFEYFNIYAKNFNSEQEGLFWSDENVKIFWTHLIRDISNIEVFKDLNYYDLITPYGYGGPLIVEKTEKRSNLIKSVNKFFDNYKKYALDNRYICEFIRFHPLFKFWELFQGIFKIQYLNDVVFVDLTKSIEELWRECRTDRKRNIKKTKKLDCKVSIISNPHQNDIEDFVRLYNITMDRNKASKKYYFSFNFIYDHFDLLKNNIILAKVKYHEKIIGVGIFFYKNNTIHYHLSGSKIIKEVAPSEMILWEIINWAKVKSFTGLLLGGGRAKNDSLFKFKKGFSKIIFPFYLGKIIFNQKIYDKLVKITFPHPSMIEDPNFFPLYRFNYSKTII